MTNDDLLFLKIDEEGYLLNNQEVLKSHQDIVDVFDHMHLNKDNFSVQSQLRGRTVIVEAFDAPLVAHRVERDKDQKWWIVNKHEYSSEFFLDSLYFDEWDRFYGLDHRGMPFVLTSEAQDQLFNLVDGFSDESISYRGQEHMMRPWIASCLDVQTESYWAQRYQEAPRPGWDLQEPAAALKDILPQLKLLKSRVLVLGCGVGHDAAFFAEKGHLVTAVDISEEAIRRGRTKYGSMKNLNFKKEDIFHLPNSYKNNFDVIFEHTCYCAIDPQQRNDLIRIWKSCLDDNGHLLGIFFTRYFPQGPPFGGSEWELRKRITPHFEPMYWTRWRQSIPPRQGTEHVIYAQVKNNSNFL